MASVHSSHHSSRLGATTGAAFAAPATLVQPSPQISSTYPSGMTVTASTNTVPVMPSPLHAGTATIHGTATIGGHTFQGSINAAGAVLPVSLMATTPVYTTTTKQVTGGDMTPQAYIQQLNEHASKTDMDNAYFGETRKVSSVVLEQQMLGSVPSQEAIRYVDVPVVEEQVKYVTRKEVVEVEKIVPKVIWDTVERVVERPVITYIDKLVEVPVEQIVEHPQVQVVEVSREVEVPEYVPKVVYKEKLVEVPGPIIEVPKIVPVERAVIKATPVDKHVPVVVAQTIKPLITESDRSIVVDVLDYEPEVVPVDVHVAKPVNSALELVGQLETRHKLVNITSAQYNSILRSLNGHMDDTMKASLPFVAEAGRVNFVPDSQAQYIVAPANVRIEGYTSPHAEVLSEVKMHVATRDLAPSSAHGTIVESQAGLGRKIACCGFAGDRTATQGPQFLSGAPDMVQVTEKAMESTMPLASMLSQASHGLASQALATLEVTGAASTAPGSVVPGSTAPASQAPVSVMRSAAPSTRRSKSTQETHRQQVVGSSYEAVAAHEGGSIRSHVVSTAAGPRSRVCC